MKLNMSALRMGLSLALAVAVSNPVMANSYRETGKTVAVANSMITITPPRDWNSLSIRPGKNAETWTLDGENLNNVTFFGAIAPGMSLYRERNKKREPLPMMRKDTLLVDIPELLEGTIRAYNSIAIFSITSSEPAKFLGKDGIRFTYKYVDNDELPRLGEAVGTIVDGKLYMASFDAPRLNYYDRVLNDYRALVSSANFK
jgi:hypothetical protein